MSTSTAALVASVAAAATKTIRNNHRHRQRRKARSTGLLCICLNSPGSPSEHSLRFLSQVQKHSKRRTEKQSAAADGGGNGPTTTSISTEELEEADKIVDGMDFGELCNEFECISSPSVEATARQLARDILELREGNRALGTYAISVKYTDPVRSFIGREKYKRPMWVTDALDKPTVVKAIV